MKRAQFIEISNRDLDSKLSLPADVFRSYIHDLFIFCFVFFLLEKATLVCADIAI